MDEWRTRGPIGVLFDVIASICTPQARKLLENYQREEATRLNRKLELKEVIKPVKTRWNSYLHCFVRAIELQEPLNDYIQCKIGEYKRNAAPKRRERARKPPKARLFIEEGGLEAKDWATIAEYVELLMPFKEATEWLQGRGKYFRHGAIWEVLVTFEWLLSRLEELKATLIDIDYEDEDAPEDHLKTNCNIAWAKINEYYSKFDDSPVYYAATRLHPSYKNHLDYLWGPQRRSMRENRQSWLDQNNRSFQDFWQSYKSTSAKSAPRIRSPRPSKRHCTGLEGFASSRTDYLESIMQAVTREQEHTQQDEYERWKAEAPLPKEDPLSANPLRYWILQEHKYPLLSRFALDILSIPASSADCERTFSELGDLLGTRRLRMNAKLLSALQCLRSWKRIGLKPSPTAKSTLGQEFTAEAIDELIEEFSS